jgi:uncharacterized protein (DUF2147 family)
MKKLSIALSAIGVLATGPVFASASSSLEGRWQRGKLVVQIAPCGRELCGTVIKASAKQQAKAERGSDIQLIGARLIKNIERTGAGSYRANVFLPDRNIHARGVIRQVSPNQLAIKGCLLAVACKSQTWQRVG